MALSHEERLDVLERITALQQDTTTVTVQIGHVDPDSNIVRHNSVYIQDAPSRILNTLADEGYRLSVDGDGVRVQDKR